MGFEGVDVEPLVVSIRGLDIEGLMSKLGYDIEGGGRLVEMELMLIENLRVWMGCLFPRRYFV